jgi:hypothetical protein
MNTERGTPSPGWALKRFTAVDHLSRHRKKIVLNIHESRERPVSVFVGCDAKRSDARSGNISRDNLKRALITRWDDGEAIKKAKERYKNPWPKIMFCSSSSHTGGFAARLDVLIANNLIKLCLSQHNTRWNHFAVRSWWLHSAPCRQKGDPRRVMLFFRLIRAMMKLSSLNYFHLFREGDELLNASTAS